MSLDDQNEPQQECNDLANAYKELSAKNGELLKILESVRKENTVVKKKYYDLKRQLDNANAVLEKNARIFHQLYDDSKSALEMGRMSDTFSPVIKKNILINNTPPPGPSTEPPKNSTFIHDNNERSTIRRKLHIEPMNLEEIRQQIEDASNEPRMVEEEPSLDASLREGLSTIIEENLTHNASRSVMNTIHESSCNLNKLSSTKILYIPVDKLPSDVVEQYLQNQTSKESSTVSVTDSFNVTDGPNFSSTPLKLETMARYGYSKEKLFFCRRMGLLPTEKHLLNNNNHNFVNMRKKDVKSYNSAKNDSMFPQDERLSLSPETKKTTPKKGKSSTSSDTKRRVTLVKTSPRPKRERVSSPPQREASLLSPSISNPLDKSMKRNHSLSKTPLFVNKRKRTNSEVKQEKESPLSKSRTGSGSRPVRKAKPQALKEPSLKKKIRRG